MHSRNRGGRMSSPRPTCGSPVVRLAMSTTTIVMCSHGYNLAKAVSQRRKCAGKQDFCDGHVLMLATDCQSWQRLHPVAMPGKQIAHARGGGGFEPSSRHSSNSRGPASPARP